MTSTGDTFLDRMSSATSVIVLKCNGVSDTGNTLPFSGLGRGNEPVLRALGEHGAHPPTVERPSPVGAPPLWLKCLLPGLRQDRLGEAVLGGYPALGEHAVLIGRVLRLVQRVTFAQCGGQRAQRDPGHDPAERIGHD